MFYLGLLPFLVLLIHECSGQNHKLLIFAQLGNKEVNSMIKNITKEDDVDVNTIYMPINPTQAVIDEACKAPRPDLILDLTIAKVASESAKKIAHYAHIPTITPTFGSEGDFLEWTTLNQVHKRIFIQIKQPLDLVPHVVRAIVVNHRYGNAAVFYDNNFVMLHKLKSLLLNMEVRHTILEYRTGLLTIANALNVFNMFVIGNHKTITTALNEVCENRFFQYKFSWYVITMEEGHIEAPCVNARFVVVSPKPRDVNMKIDFGNTTVFRLSNEFFHDLVKISYAVVKRVPKSNLKELCDDGSKENFGNMKIGEYIKETITHYNKEKKIITDKYFINDLWTSEAIVEMELHGYLKGENETEMEKIAEWSSRNFAVLKNKKNMEKYASQIIYKISVAIQEPFIVRDENSPYNYSGFCVDLIESIAEKVGFKFILYSPEGSGFRYDFEATLREVMYQRADIGLAPMSITNERARNVDFTIPFYELVGMLIMMKIPESSKSFFKIIEVLGTGVWVMLLVLFFVTSFLVWLYDKFSPYSYQNNRERLADSDEKREFTLRESFWFSLTSVTSQGGGEAPRPLSGKIVSGVWWLFGFLIVASYTANLAAFLTASHLESSIESLEDLSKQYRVKYGVINGSNGMRYFKTLSESEIDSFKDWERRALPDYNENKVSHRLYAFNNDYPITNMYSKMLKFMTDSKSMPNTLEEAIARVQSATPSDNYAYIGDATDIKFAVMTNCDLQAIGDEFAKKFYSLAIRKSSPLKEPLDNALMELLNERKLEKIKNKWWRENPKVAVCGNRRYQSDGITIQNVVGVFLLIGVGIVISLIIMGLENLYNKVLDKKMPEPEVSK